MELNFFCTCFMSTPLALVQLVLFQDDHTVARNLMEAIFSCLWGAACCCVLCNPIYLSIGTAHVQIVV